MRLPAHLLAPSITTARRQMDELAAAVAAANPDLFVTSSSCIAAQTTCHIDIDGGDGGGQYSSSDPDRRGTGSGSSSSSCSSGASVEGDCGSEAPAPRNLLRRRLDALSEVGP